jgi:hypothetical protein
LTEAPSYSPLNIPECLLKLAQTLLDQALPLQIADAIALQARQRNIMRRKPGGSGKSPSDCEIIESYFALGRELGKRAEPRLFVSSNKEDFFSQQAPDTPHEDLRPDCAVANLEFVNNLSQAVSALFGRAALEPLARS